MSEHVGLTKEDLKDILKANSAMLLEVVQEMKKPAPLTEQETAKIEQEQQMRIDQAESVKQKNAKDKWDKHTCSHKHKRGDTHCVFILDGNYILCQKCQGKVRPGAEPKGYTGDDIYDTNLFNTIFQEVNGGDLFE